MKDDKIQLYAPISKTDEEQHMVYGYASTEALDSQGEVVTKKAMKGAFDDYMKYANIREMHQASAVGKTKQAQLDEKGMYIGAKVVDKNAWEKVKEGVYNGFSIGGRVMEMVDNEITNLVLSEISLVDRPANPEAVFDVWKGEGLNEDKKVEVNVEVGKDEVNVKVEKADEQEVKPQSEQPTAIEGTQEVKPSAEQPITEEGTIKEPQEEVKEPKEEIKPKIKPGKKPEVKPELQQDTVEEPETIPTLPEEDKTEDKVVVKPKATTEKPISATTAFNKDAVKLVEEIKIESVEEKPAKEVKVEPVVEKIPVEVIQEKISAWEMPTNEEITKYFETNEVKVDDKTIGLFRFKVAGKILELVEKSMEDDKNKQMVKAYYEKLAKDVDGKDIKDLKGNEKIAMLIKQAEAVLVKDVTPAENDRSGDQAKLSRVAELISQFNGGAALTEAEMEELKNGLAFASERFGGGHIGAPLEDEAEVEPKGEIKMESTEMQKMVTEIEELKAQVQKLNDVPEEVKVKASYTVIEKFDNSTDELKKAELEVEKVSGELKANPYDVELQKKANTLSALVMKLHRTSN
jgi:phage head maturation protease